MAWTRENFSTWAIPGVAFISRRSNGLFAGYIVATETICELGIESPKAARQAMEALLA